MLDPVLRQIDQAAYHYDDAVGEGLEWGQA